MSLSTTVRKGVMPRTDDQTGFRAATRTIPETFPMIDRPGGQRAVDDIRETGKEMCVSHERRIDGA